MATVVKLILSVILSVGLTNSYAQKPKPAAANNAANKKPPPIKLRSSLGPLTDSVTILAEEAVQLIGLPLKVTDDKKNLYSIVSYQVFYKRKIVSEDEETGKAIPGNASSAAVFKTTPLPGIWKNLLTEQLKPGEELLFFDIAAKDAQGHLSLAPDLKIKIK